MTPGKLARKILGRYTVPVGNVYRRIFVDLGIIAKQFDSAIPRNARILDIGGGDGALIEFLLDRRPDLTVTMCDRAPSIGEFLTSENRTKVTLFPATDLSEISGQFDCVTITDVIHHIPVEQRDGFFSALAVGCRRWGCRKLLFKDVEPGGWRSVASLLSDRYITGDLHTVLFPRAEFATMMARHFPQSNRTSTMPDWPNYCEIVSW
jgi:2-polyprenyl-6-hydroxyphenyl methylase/3-demethylubiquinone-9 3-methyltransferase